MPNLLSSPPLADDPIELCCPVCLNAFQTTWDALQTNRKLMCWVCRRLQHSAALECQDEAVQGEMKATGLFQ